MRPINNLILIEVKTERESSIAGIVLPDEPMSQEGVIRASNDTELPVGAKVVFSKYGPADVKIDGKAHVFAKKSEILAIIDE